MDITTVHQAIRRCEIFGGLDEAHIDFLVKNGQPKNFPEGSTIYQKGEPADGTFCLLVSGNVNIISERSEELYSIGAGSILGEIGTISPQTKRTITVRAAVPVEVVEWDFEEIEKELPELFEKLRDLARERTLNWYY